MDRIIIHWTGGAYGVIPMEADSYNCLVDEKGVVRSGDFPPEAQTATNVKRGSKYYAAHTLNLNTGSIGVAMDAMGGAQENPFVLGKWPITPKQLEGCVALVASLSKQYGIPVTRKTILTHAEVQRTLGVRQNNKWDVCWIPGMSKPGDPIEVGDRIREMVREALKTPSSPAPSKGFFAMLLDLLRRMMR